MPETGAFERRLEEALVLFADEIEQPVDASAVAHAVAERQRRRGWALRIAAVPQVAWLLLAAALLLALVVGLVGAGSLLQGPRPPVLRGTGSGVELVVPGPPGSASVVTGRDGEVWAFLLGQLVRLDTRTGGAQTWDVSDDIAFLSPSLAPATEGGVWLTTGREIRRFDGRGFVATIAIPPDLPNVWAVVESPAGTVWATGAEGAIWRWSDGTWTTVATPHPRATAGALAVDAGGRPWVAEMTYPGPTVDGVSRLDGSSWTTFGPADAAALAGDGPSIATGPDGTVWVGTSAGVARYDGTAWASFDTAELGATGPWSVAADADGTAWAASTYNSGPVVIARLEGEAWTTYGAADGLPGADATGISMAGVAVSGRDVVAATHAGLYRPVGDLWERSWPAAEPLTAPLLDLVAASGDEAWGVWVGSWGNDTSELWHFGGIAASLESVGDGAPAIRDLALAPDGALWAATSGGVAVRTAGRWTVVDPRPASGIAIGADGTVLLRGGEARPGVWTLRPEGSRWTAGDVPDPPLEGGSPAMAVDRDGDLWIAGGRMGWVDEPGLFRFDGQRWEAMEPVDNSDATVFNNIVAAPDGAVWVTVDSTSDGGCCPPADPATQVARFDGERWTVYGTGDGLPEDNVELSLAAAPDGTVWLSSPGGLSSFDGQRWTVRLPGRYLGRLAAAPDGTLWASGWAGVLHLAELPR